MRHVSAAALVQSSRFARLFELIRQENLRDQQEAPRVEDQRDFVNDFLMKSAQASLHRAA
ncbi:hypothetical protein [Shimia isoporae]|uniref:hypothetical protein n=1 Tax=Shimia isoporae TaxID=647720 RepID=UPI0010451D3D|nr:hypothetical protein [Shimia isoporae]